MIDLTPLTEDLNIHQSLDNQPALTAQELKVAWDSPAAKIKTYLNNLTQTELPADLNTELTNTLNAAKSYTDTAIAGISQAAEDISFDNTGTGLTGTNVQDAIEEVNTAVNTQSTGKTTYSDFVTEEKSANYSLTQSTNAPLTFTYTKSGYFPLAISSVRLSTWYEVDTMTPAYFDTQQVGKAVVKMLVAHGNTAASISGTAYVRIVWIKVR